MNSLLDYTFSGCTSLESVTISKGITTISEKAFSSCSNVKELIYADGCTAILRTWLSSPESVVIPNSATSIAESAFYNFQNLTNVNIPDGVKSIEEQTFYNCYSLTSISIPPSVLSIEYNAFRNCSNLKKLIYNDGCTTTVRTHIKYIEEVVIPNSVTSIAEEAFWGNTKLKCVTLPVDLTSIDKGAFAGCTALIDIEIPENVTSIAYGAFDGCTRLTKVTSLSTTPPTIESGTFSKYGTLYVPYKSVSAYQQADFWKNFTIKPIYFGTCGDDVIWNLDEDGVLTISGIGEMTENPWSEIKGSVKSVVIQNGVTNICESAFEDCSELTEISIANSVTRISERAFCGCSNLTNIVIPDGVTSIADYVFQGCSNLESVHIPEKVTVIGKMAFAECISLNSVTIPDNVVSIGEDAFRNCSSLCSVMIKNMEVWCGIEFANETANPLCYAHNLYVDGVLVEDLTIPSSIENLRNYAFYCCTSLTSVIIPHNVTSIGYYTFYGCSNLKSIHLTSIPTITGTDIFPHEAIIYVTENIYKEANKIFPNNRVIMKVLEPEISYDGEIKIYCGTTDAKIYYTLNGSDPSALGKLYTEPIGTMTPCIVKAVAKIDEYSVSDITTFVLTKEPAPEISYVNGNIYMRVDSDDTQIYYTLDGSEPTNKSTLYSGKFEAKGNYKIRAIGYQENHINSDIVEYQITGFKAQQPQISYTNQYLYIVCDSPDSQLYYTIDGSDPKTNGRLYSNPVYIENNFTAKAYAIGDYLEASDVATYTMSDYTCEPVSVMAYNGRYLTLSTTTAKAEIHYTLDGSTPKKTSAKYTEAVDVKGITTIRAIVVRDNYNDSKESSYKTTYYYDGETVSTSEAGTIANAFEWCGTDKIENVTVKGNIDESDISFISTLRSLRHLNLEDANVIGNTIAAGTFAYTPLVSVFFPKTLTSVGSGLFTGCDNLAAIVWNANMTLPLSVLNGISNPNLLLYVKLNSYAPSSLKNVVANGVAENIVLYDGEGNNNFYVPQAFTAKRIAYSHNYSQKTIIGKCAGWETIALPFDVQNIIHSKNGGISPFASNDATAKPFWLYSLGDLGFTAASNIKANTPYIISMPNNEDYVDEYILGGDVTFSAENVTVPATTQSATSKGDIRFIPTTMTEEQGAQIYAINKGLEYQGQQPGSMFVGDLRSVVPFEAYLTLSSQMAKANVISFTDLGFDDDATGIDIPTKKSGMKVWSTGATIYISTDKAKAVSIYSVSGTLIRTVELHEGVNAIKGITPGMYVVGQMKVCVK